MEMSAGIRAVMRSALAGALLVVASPQAVAGPPERSIRPLPRIAQIVDTASDTVARPTVVVRYDATIRPRPRLATRAAPATSVMTDTTPAPAPASTAANVPFGAAAASEHPDEYALASTTPVFASPRPVARPDGLARWAENRARRPSTDANTRVASTDPTLPSGGGSVCRDPAIRGERIAPIAGTLPGCGVAQPVRVTSIDGIGLSQASIMDCETARAIKSWIRTGLRPSVGRTGGGPAQLHIAAHYSCRTRNSQPGARISEHGKGRAIDISAIRLRDGSDISVLNDWGSGRKGRILAKLHDSACGPFGTVLGPEANKFHRDHFHFDTAHYRGGPYCR